MLGAILRIDASQATPEHPYAIPPDNPFVNTLGTDGRGEIWPYGLRNPWRFSFDRATGELWAGDVGQNRWEETDLIQRGGNYGWNTLEANHCFRPATAASNGHTRAFTTGCRRNTCPSYVVENDGCHNLRPLPITERMAPLARNRVGRRLPYREPVGD